MINAMMADKSDCQVVIMGVALIDKMLTKSLKNQIGGKPRLKTKVLSSYSTRRLLAHCLGIISYQEWKVIETMGEVRNRFAHDYPTPTFETESVSHHCEILSAKAGIGLVSNRQTFIEAVNQILGSIIAYEENQAHYLASHRPSVTDQVKRLQKCQLRLIDV